MIKWVLYVYMKERERESGGLGGEEEEGQLDVVFGSKSIIKLNNCRQMVLVVNVNTLIVKDILVRLCVYLNQLRRDRVQYKAMLGMGEGGRKEGRRS